MPPEVQVCSDLEIPSGNLSLSRELARELAALFCHSEKLDRRCFFFRPGQSRRKNEWPVQGPGLLNQMLAVWMESGMRTQIHQSVNIWLLIIVDELIFAKSVTIFLETVGKLFQINYVWSMFLVEQIFSLPERVCAKQSGVSLQTAKRGDTDKSNVCNQNLRQKDNVSVFYFSRAILHCGEIMMILVMYKRLQSSSRRWHDDDCKDKCGGSALHRFRFEKKGKSFRRVTATKRNFFLSRNRRRDLE